MLNFIYFSQIGVVDGHSGRPRCALGIGGGRAVVRAVASLFGLVILNCVVKLCNCMILSLGLTSDGY